jgi:transposase-like protein
MSKDKMACPKCGSEDYEVGDYGENFNDEDYYSRWWLCRCKKCDYCYEVEKIYNLVRTLVNGN